MNEILLEYENKKKKKNSIQVERTKKSKNETKQSLNEII